MSASFDPKPTPRRPSAVTGSHSSITPAASRFRSSLVPMQRASPLRSSQGPSRVTSRVATAPAAARDPIVKDLFRTTTTPKSSRTTPFAPKLPAEATKTPASVRKLAPKGAGAGMAGTTSQELFKLRIPSPDPDLTGAEISKAVPDNLKNRKGTVYADQYLAHKCPPEFDDDQRRQFFCILDLRRLKFAANEIFAKKDWKLNIINFAKEYEKSRGLIMLRYGLYEFKNVKPSEEVMKRWRKAHGLPEPEAVPEKATTNTTSFKASLGPTASKRKADDDMQSKDNTLQTSVFGQNKRRNVDQEATGDVHKFGPTPVKSKRKADETDDGDENSRNKLQKATPSAARSRLEGIINNVQSGTSTPVGSPLKRPTFGASASATTGAPAAPLFGITNTDDASKSAFATKSNPYGPPSNGVVDSSKLKSTLFQPGQALNGSKDSVLAAHKFGSSLAPKPTNIFGYLSESSANNSGAENGNDDADDDTDSESGESQPETGSQDAAPSYEPSAAASTGTATPPITGGAGSSLFGFSKPAAPTSNPFASTFNKPAETQPEKTIDNAPKGGLFGRVSFGSDGQPLRETTETPRALSPAKEAAPEKVPTATPAKGPGDFTFNPATTPITFGKDSSSLFSAPSGSTKDDSSKASEPEKADTAFSSSIFTNSQAKTATTDDTPKSLFGTKQPEPPSQPLFGAKQAEQPSKPLFGANQPEQPSKPLFGAKPLDQPTSTAQQPSQPLFGNLNKAAEPEKPAPTSASGGLFGATFSSQSDSSAQQPSQPLFGGFQKTPENDKTDSAAPPPPPATSLFTTQPPSTGFSFGSTATPKPLFGEASKPTETDASSVKEQPKNPFGSHSGFGAPTMTNGDSATPKEPAQNVFSSQTLFGKSSADTGPSTPSAAPLFGGFQPATEPPKPTSNLFGNAATSSAPNPFGGNNSSTNTFGTPSANLFGSGAAGTSTKRSAEEDLQPAKKFMFGRAESNDGAASQAAPTPFAFGGSQPAASNNQQEKKSLFSNVTGDTAGAGSPVPGRKILTPKRLRGAGAARQASPSPAPSFEGSALFGSQTPKPETGNSFGNSNASFAFGQQNDASITDNNASSSFTFGQTSQSNGAAAGGSSSFTFGAGPSAPGGGSFQFGAGGNDSSNPFGGASGTPTPAGSFNFQFGGQAPSTPAPAGQSSSLFGSQTNGATPAPTFSFTGATPQPTPQQSSTNLFAPQPSAPSIFSGLQAGSSAPGANSPFAAPSSINTTPVNGTPEPQADGDAEPPQEQISLTQGGPGEEDEEVVFEVRAKAMKYVVVKPGEDSPASKSPWKTEGVGPLRLLKHKVTGSVRILLRGEPRGQIAMNKALLAGVNYKADGKTVKVMASNDDGSGLETWVLQVKKPESAVELANIMESYKTSNK